MTIVLRTARLAGGVSALALGVMAAGAAQAAEGGPAYRLAIAAKPLPAALAEFAAATGVTIVRAGGDGAPLAGRSLPISGRYRAEDGLRAMLEGSGLIYSFADPRNVTIYEIARDVMPVQLANEVTELDEISVEGRGSQDRRPQTGTIGQPPAPYAGGQVASGTRLGVLGNRSTLETPFSAIGFTEKLNRDQQSQTIGDVALNDPSVRNDAPPFSERDSFFIRGFSVTNLDVFYDGLPYLANARRHFLEGIERVEILKGPSTLVNGGTDRVGGTINLVPKRAADEPLTRVTTSYRSDLQLGTHVDVGRRFGPDGAWGIRANGSYRNGDTALDRNESEVGVATLGLDYRSDQFRAALDLNHSTQNITAPTSLFNSAVLVPGFDIPKAPNGRKNTANSFEYIDSTHNMAAGRMEFDIAPETTLYMAGGASRYREDFLTSSYQIINDDGDALATLAIQPQQIQGFSGEVGLRSQFETAFIGHRLNISASRALNENYRGGFVPPLLPTFPTNIYNPSSLPNGSVDTSGFARASDLPLFADLLLTSYAISDTLSFAEDRFQLTLGGRYQELRSRGFNTRPDRGEIGDSTFFNEDERFSPAVAALVRVTEAFSVYGNYVESLTAGLLAPVNSENSGDIFPATVNKQKEIGVKYDFGSFGVTAALFEIEQPNGFTTPPPQGSPPGTLGRFDVDGLQINRGIEVSVFGEPFQGVRLLGGVTFLDAKLAKTGDFPTPVPGGPPIPPDGIIGDFDGNEVPGVPSFAVNLYGEYDLPWVAGLTATARMLYAGKTFYDQRNTQEVDDWTRVDLGMRYAFTGPAEKPVVIRANVNNVFDEAYWSSSARGFLAVGAPRTFVLSASMDF